MNDHAKINERMFGLKAIRQLELQNELDIGNNK